ncbi:MULTISPECIES: hypothetical protein [Acidovorax]|uniref:hypothetical protein n=1 Tax=Acidovorax TaxID=12916 RepID=UPI00258CC20F|nr:hypothetical protein [Acidovorax sp.]
MKGLPAKMMADVKEFQRILPCAQHRQRQVPCLAASGNAADRLGVAHYFEAILGKIACP